MKKLSIFSVITLVSLSLAFNVLKPLPPGSVAPYLNGKFPRIAPGLEKVKVNDVFPDVYLQSPLRILEFPTPNNLLVLNKQGEIYSLDREQQTKQVVLDITDRTFKLGDGGSVGLALHPEFWINEANQWVFVYYRTTPTPDNWSSPGYNVLSKFKWDDVCQCFDKDSEEILIQQYDRSPWHNGGDLFFDKEGLLYISIGDEGFDEFQTQSTQNIDGGFFSGVLRIDIDNDMSRSHPIRRQPQQLATPVNGWTKSTFSQGYSIPNDNPWLSETGEVLEEFYSIGQRSPYNMFYNEINGDIWIADVGSDIFEEVNLVRKGDNHQWPYIEGNTERVEHEKPLDLLGNEKLPVYQYARSSGYGSCIIGGFIYQGDDFFHLKNNYVFADFTTNKVFALAGIYDTGDPLLKVIINDLNAFIPDLPDKSKIVAIESLSNGEILICLMGEEHDSEGKILSIRNNETNPVEVPQLLSELDVFDNLQDLDVIEGVLPYTVNAPLWSDGATKQRWMIIPNDGTFDSAAEKIIFSPEDYWQFPPGTVFIKHFEMPIDERNPFVTKRLETRFFIIDENRVGYGVTYKWNESNTEAYLVESEFKEDIEITTNDGTTFTQSWTYPSVTQCSSCHNSNANYVLGVQTHQLNGDFYYPHMEREMNQLEFWNEIGVFDKNINNPNGLARSIPMDDPSSDLDHKIMSYLDANCASCHNENSDLEVDLDFRYGSPKKLMRYIDAPTKSHASSQADPIIKAGEHENSELWVRDAKRGENQMPPLATTIVDQEYVDGLAKWIDGLPDLPIDTYHDLLLFPNPVQDLACLQVSESIQLPAEMQIWSLTGRLIIQSNLEESFSFQDFHYLHTGKYLLVIKSEDQTHKTKFTKL